MIMHKDFYSHERWLALFFFTLVGLSFLWVGCGKKGPPKPPERRSPQAVKDLSYAIDNQIVELSWTVQGSDDRSASSPAGYKVFRSKLSAKEPNCEKCPIRFGEIGDVAIQMKRSETSKPTRMRFTEVLEPGYRYIYKVIIYDEDGKGSEDSNFVKFEY